jgi:hypothetical protein
LTFGRGTFPSGKEWIAIEILQPIQLQLNQAEFRFTFTPTTMGARPAIQTLQAEGTTTALQQMKKIQQRMMQEQERLAAV